MNSTAKKIKIEQGDLVLQEIWRIKDRISADYGQDLKRYFADLRERQNNSGHAIVTLQNGKRVEIMPN